MTKKTNYSKNLNDYPELATFVSENRLTQLNGMPTSFILKSQIDRQTSGVVIMATNPNGKTFMERIVRAIEEDSMSAVTQINECATVSHGMQIEVTVREYDDPEQPCQDFYTLYNTTIY